jgi:hypothetical protein
MPMMGAVRAVAKDRCTHGEADFQFGGVKNFPQKRQQWLGAVDVEKRAHSREHGRDRRLVESLHEE